MSNMTSSLAELLVECDAHGIRLVAAIDDFLTFDAPQDALTPDVLERLKVHKTELLALLRQTPAFDVGSAPDAEPTPVVDPVTTSKPICRCGSTTWRDVPIHDGQSMRRECSRCGRFIEFPIWYGNGTLHNEQYPIG